MKLLFVDEEPLEPSLAVFRENEKLLLQSFRNMWMAGNALFHLDFYIQGIVNRSLSLLYGFETVLLSRNFITAAHLVRPHLDNFLRLYAAWLVEHPHDFAARVMAGEQVNKLKCREKKFLTDAYLKVKATREYPWIKNVYEETSGFIHFSRKQVFSGMKIKDKQQGIVSGNLSRYDVNVSIGARLEALECMTEITSCIIGLIDGYASAKLSKQPHI